MSVLAPLGSLAAGAGLGLGSALLPVVNAEAYVVLVSVSRPAHLLVALTVIAVAAGQTAGKVLLFEAGRQSRMPAWLARRVPARGHAGLARTSERLGELLRRPRTGALVVAASATLGLPPLAVVTVAAGAAGQRRTVFAVLCLLGRVVRFAAVAAPVALI